MREATGWHTSRLGSILVPQHQLTWLAVLARAATRLHLHSDASLCSCQQFPHAQKFVSGVS